MKIAIFVHSLSAGGAERVTTNLANHWAGKDCEVAVVTLGDKADDFYTLHPRVTRIALNLAGDSKNFAHAIIQNMRRIAVLRRLLRRHRPHIALAMTARVNALLSLAAYGVPQVVVIGSERVHPPKLPLGASWESLRRYSYRGLAAVVAQTQESARWIQTHTNAKHIVVIPNPVTWPIPSTMPTVDPEALLGPDRNVILAVGRLDTQKGFDRLIEAFHKLARGYPTWALVIIGQGTLRETHEKQIHALGLVNRVFLPGRVGNLTEWYERAELYAMSSYFEGFPNTLVEAMAHGLPAISFDCETGPKDIIRHNVDGILVPEGDLVSFTFALERLMREKETRVRFALRAMEVRDRFSMERIGNLWETLFEDVTNKCHVRQPR